VSQVHIFFLIFPSSSSFSLSPPIPDTSRKHAEQRDQQRV
jgi:hypothetical protein